MIDVRVPGYSIREILAGPPSIDDQIETVCRTLDLTIKDDKLVKDLLGKTVEVWKDNERWYHGIILRRGISEAGTATLKAYDPLIFFKKNTDDFYYKNTTATRIIEDLAYKTGIGIKSLANTRVVLPPLYYQAAEPEKIATDVLARTKRAGGNLFWYRWDPKAPGIHLFEKKLPSHIWAFQVGVNLTAASYEESAEEIVTQVKLVNRETGKEVVRYDSKLKGKYGQRQHFEEVSNENGVNIERLAKQRLTELSKLDITSQATGINPGNMPQFFSGDVIYVEERFTGLMGAYHIRNITQTLESENLITVGLDITAAPDIPTITYENATEDPNKDD